MRRAWWVGAAGLLVLSALALARLRPAGPADPGIAEPPSPDGVPGSPPASDPPPDLASPSAVRSQARHNSRIVKSLADLLRDPAADFATRARAALVLGSLEGEASRRALMAELTGATDPRWIRVLLLALGSEKSAPDPFALAPDGPWMRSEAGLNVCVRHRIDEAEARQLVAGFLHHSDAEVRRAALEALYHSLDHADARISTAASMDADRQDDLRAHAAKALSEWIARQGEPSAERSELVGRIVRRATRPEETLVRLRTEAHLAAALLSEGESRALLSLTGAADTEVRRWGLEVAAKAAAKSGGALASDVVLRAAELARSDRDVKMREAAARSLGSFTTSVPARDALIAAASDPEWNVRCQAVRSLRRFAAAPETQAALRKAASDPDERVRSEATR